MRRASSITSGGFGKSCHKMATRRLPGREELLAARTAARRRVRAPVAVVGARTRAVFAWFLRWRLALFFQGERPEVVGDRRVPEANGVVQRRVLPPGE